LPTSAFFRFTTLPATVLYL